MINLVPVCQVLLAEHKTWRVKSLRASLPCGYGLTCLSTHSPRPKAAHQHDPSLLTHRLHELGGVQVVQQPWMQPQKQPARRLSKPVRYTPSATAYMPPHPATAPTLLETCGWDAPFLQAAPTTSYNDTLELPAAEDDPASSSTGGSLQQQASSNSRPAPAPPSDGPEPTGGFMGVSRRKQQQLQKQAE